jgi:hypothetical protein
MTMAGQDRSEAEPHRRRLGIAARLRAKGLAEWPVAVAPREPLSPYLGIPGVVFTVDGCSGKFSAVLND